MEKAAIYVSKSQWIDAAAEWQKVISGNKGRLKAKAAFNLALANEMLGKFDLSIEWLRNARKYYPLPEIDDYQKTIEKRINLFSN
jgi:tetratricopeptide (TPR) repeat protein